MTTITSATDYANDVSVDMTNKHGKRDVAAFEQNAMFFEFRFFHFPMVAILGRYPRHQPRGGDWSGLRG